MKVVEVLYLPQRPYFRCILINFRELYSNCDIHLRALVNNVNDVNLTTDVN